VTHEHEQIVPADEIDTSRCQICGTTVTTWRKVTIRRRKELVTNYYCTACGEFVSGFRGPLPPDLVGGLDETIGEPV